LSVLRHFPVAKSQIFRVLSSEAETSSFESDDQDTSEIP